MLYVLRSMMLLSLSLSAPPTRCFYRHDIVGGMLERCDGTAPMCEDAESRFIEANGMCEHIDIDELPNGMMH